MRVLSTIRTSCRVLPRHIGATLLAAALIACTGQGTGWPDHGLATASELGRSTAASYLSGRFALERGDVQAATDFFQRALKAEPDNLELRRQVFTLQIASGAFDAALPSARKLLEVDPDAEDAKLLRALSHVRDGRLAEVREALATLGGRGIIGVIAPVLRAWARFGVGDSAGALEMLEARRGDDGFATLRAYHRGMILGLSGKKAAARDELARLFKDDEPAPLRVVLALAALDGSEGLRDSAIARLDRQLEISGDNIVLGDARAVLAGGGTLQPPIRDARSGMADALLGLAVALHEQRISGQALVYARLASFLEPQQGDVWLLIGRIALAQENPEAAIAAFERVPAGMPHAWEAQLARAEALRELKRGDEAIAALRNLAAQRPERIDALVALGDLLRRDEKFAEAEAAYSEALARLPKLERQHWRLLYVRGIAYERTKRWPQAEADFLKALELFPEQPLVLNYLGYSWVDQNLNLDRAKQMLHRAVELRPDDGFIVDSLGWAYFRLGEYENATTHLERAVELEPGDPTINDHLGDAYWRVGRQREARFQWQRALTLKPEKDVAEVIEEKLARGLPARNPDRG